MHASLTPDLLITTYHGSPIQFAMVPEQAGQTITNLSDYDQIDFSVWSGSRDAPGEVVLPIRYTGDVPTYATVDTVEGDPAVVINVPGTASGNLPAGQYFAELWLTPPGGEPIFAGWAYWNHEPTTFGAGA